MQREGLLLLVHGEVTDPAIDIFDREAVFIDQVMTPLRIWATWATCIQASVSAAAGRLPSASRRTTCQSTVPALWCTAVPKLLVMEA